MTGYEDAASEGRLARWVQRTIEHPRIVYRGGLVLAGLTFTVTALFPIYWMLVLAVSPDMFSPSLLPTDPTPAILLAILTDGTFLRYLLNTVVVATASTLIVLVVSTFAGYAFGRLEFRFKRPLLFVTLLVSFFPPAAFLMPLFRLVTGNVEVLGVRSPVLFNTPGALLIPYSALFLPLSIFVLTMYFSQIPDELEAAARVEGTTRVGALFRVILPLSKPGLVTAGVLTFIAVYNEYFFAFVMVDGQADNWATIAWGLNFGMVSQFAAAAGVVALLPVAVLVFVLQSRITRVFDANGG